MEIRNILIVGRTNSGKSALANVLCDTEFFEENERTVRNSKEFQEYTFELNVEDMKYRYRVADVKFKSNEKEYLCNKIKEIIKLMPEGISQVLFVIDQRLLAEEIKTLGKFESLISKSGVARYTTIVRTKFDNFKIVNECEDDKKEFLKFSKKLFKNMDFVHVDNPPTHIYMGGDDETVNPNRKRRLRSRNILLNHLKTKEEYYRLKKWDNPEELEKDPSVAKIIKSKKCKSLCAPS